MAPLVVIDRARPRSPWITAVTSRLIVPALALGLLAAPVSVGAHHGSQSVLVRMQGGEFSPATVTIRQGDTIILENRDVLARWPASNIHPTHHIYPEFDARAPVPPGERWAFTFARPGVWNYHDHLAPGVSGSVVVEADAGAARDSGLWQGLTARAIRGYRGVLPGHQTRWISRQDLHFPCNAGGEDYFVQYHCYHFQTSWMLAVHRDFARVAAECLRARTEMIPVCFDSFGRDVATQSSRNPAAILAVCAQVPEAHGYYGKCLSGAIPVITDFWGANLGDQATELCRQAPPAGKPACYVALHGRLKDVFDAPADRERICQNFEPSYRKLCGPPPP